MFPHQMTPASRPPQRTYGRRSNGKRPPPRVVDSDSDTETEEAEQSSSRNGTPGTDRSAKRARTFPSDKSNEGSPSIPTANPGLLVQPPSSSPASRPVNNGTPSRLSALSLSRESTPGAGNNESQESTSSYLSAGGTRRPRPPRRMLSKAQSMATSMTPKEVTPPSTPQRLRASQSMPITPGSAASQKTDGSDNAAGSPLPSLMAPIAPGSPSGGRAKRTYGRNRTFLGTEMSLDAAPQESYAELRKRYEVDNDEGEGGSGNLMDLLLARAPEPISDMRSKGESKRFADEITYLLGGITEAASAALKRNSSIDILRNMQEDGWVAKMDIHGETERVFETLCGASGNDEVMDTVLILFFALLSSGKGLITVLRCDADKVMSTILKGLSTRNGPLDLAYKGKVTNTVQRLRAIAAKLPGGSTDENHHKTTRGVASRLLSRMCNEQMWPAVEGLMTHRRIASNVLSELATEIRPISDRLELHSKGLDLIPKDSDVDIGHVEECLEVLSTIVTCSADERERIAEIEHRHIQDVMSAAVVMSLAALDEDGDADLQRHAARCTVQALKLLSPLVSLSSLQNVLVTAHRQPGFITALSRILLERERITTLAKAPSDGNADTAAASLEPSESADDILSYVLAVLGSVICADASAASAVASSGGGSCGKRGCALTCNCGGDKFATTLARLYAEFGAHTDEVLKGYLHGYLAFLVTSLLERAGSRALIEPSLPGKNWRAKLSDLLTVVRELRSFRVSAHHKIHDLIKEATHGDDSLQAKTPDPEDDEKLNSAITFLERAMRTA